MKLMYPRTDSSRFDTTLRNKVYTQALQHAAIDESLHIEYVTINRMFRSITIFYRYPSLTSISKNNHCEVKYSMISLLIALHKRVRSLKRCHDWFEQTVCDTCRLQTWRLGDLQTCRLADLQTCRLADLESQHTSSSYPKSFLKSAQPPLRITCLPEFPRFCSKQT